jgi:hypothetical protein
MGGRAWHLAQVVPYFRAKYGTPYDDGTLSKTKASGVPHDQKVFIFT